MTVTPTTGPPGAAPAVRRVLAQARFETRAILSNGEQLLVSLALPLLALAGFVLVGAAPTRVIVRGTALFLILLGVVVLVRLKGATRLSGGTAVYRTPDNQSGRQIQVNRLVFDQGVEYIGVLGGRPFVLNLRATECQDSMADERFPLTARLTVAGQTQTGCASPAQPAAPAAEAAADAAPAAAG